MLESIISALASAGKSTMPWVVVHEYERAVLYSWGTNSKVLDPGFHWKWPFKHTYQLANITVSPLNLSCQSLTTRDSKKLTIGLLGRFRITDVLAYYNKVSDATDLLIDILMGSASEIVSQTNLIDINGLEDRILHDTRDEIAEWGIELLSVRITDFQESRTLRLIHESGQKNLTY